MSYLALSDSFENLCYGSTATKNILILTVRGSSLDVRIAGIDFSHQNLTSTDVRF